jgi:carbonic anhydrase
MSAADAAGAARRLLEGNAAFVKAHGADLRRHIAGQSPFAAVLTCSDSRVPPEIIFNAGIGDIFVVRDAGNVALDDSVIGSLEYAVWHLHVPLVLILGHTYCGALKAAEGGPGDGSHIGNIVNEIRCCFDHADHLRENVRRQVDMLAKRSPVIAEAVKSGAVKIRGAIYHMEDGTVEPL